MLLALVLGAYAGAPADFHPGVEGQWGFGPPAASADGQHLALTRWDRAGLWVWDRETGTVDTVTEARGAGFRPAWDGDALTFKAVDADGQAAVRWQDGVTTELARDGRLGQPLPLGPGRVAWTQDGALHTEAGVLGAAPDVDLYEPAPDGLHAAWHDDAGRLRLTDLRTGESRTLTTVGGASHPRWSDDGAKIVQVTTDDVQIVDVRTGDVLTLPGRDPAWVPGTHELVYAFVETGADAGPELAASPYEVLSASIVAVDADSGATRTLLDDDQLHPRHPLPLATGELYFVDSLGGALWRLTDAGAVQALEAPAGSAPPPPPSTARVETSVPYMHQLWDTPDNFDGGWSCGPTSLAQTMQKWSVLPDWDMTASWPYAHTSHWGNYIPNTYSFGGYTYDYTGVSAGGYCQGAHGFVCREYGGAVWSYMVLFLQQHGLWADYAGTDYNTLISEANAGWPMVASVSVLGYGHIISVRGYVTEDGSPIHTIVVNDPYGNGGSGDWGNYDGEDITYDWPGYNNGNLEIGLSELFYAHGTAPPVEETPVEETPVDTGTAPVDTGTADSGSPDETVDPTTPPDDEPRTAALPGDLSVMESGGCQTARGGTWLVAAIAALLLRRARRPE